jgi:hypothetical protein
MRNTTKLVMVSLFVLLMGQTVAVAQMTPESSTLIIDQTSDIGGTVLEPGTYTIHSIAESNNRSVIQVTSTDGQKVYATVVTVPHHMEARDTKPSTEFVYFPAGEGQPRALRTWYPSDPVRTYDAYDIVYQESRAKQLARLAKGNVVSYSDQVATTDLGTTELHSVTPEETVEVYTPMPSATVTQTEVAETRPAMETQVEAAPAAETQIAESRPMELPRTAGNLPLVALLSLLSLAAAVTIRFTR